MTISRQWLILSIAFALVLIVTSTLLPVPWFEGKTVLQQFSPPSGTTQTFHLITTEYTTKVNGKKLEVYRWNPDTIIVHKGDQVKLVLHGIHGKEHQWSLQDFNRSGTIHKGKTSEVSFTANKVGTFALVCHNHQTPTSNGPMTAYITVLDSVKK
ncbi:Cupredoxin-like domain-containing protein [Marininema mesophilum]|uniref:Cupredoxin-like domain-containing protein n=1 Tax=Marininema mesophilum TaxID=1048340 RepID=A0A1H2U643_9BACL|nr:cupredoxin domain-containing protein [Marininema mesophilum]SDW51713.1 Cupredoxin-like domain-containing protein [Marininema mesophilum]